MSDWVTDWRTPEMVGAEITQRREEGCATAELSQQFGAAGSAPGATQILQLWAAAETLTPQRDFPYAEPVDLAGIRACRPDGPRRMALKLTPEALYDKVYGGWLGRAAGCLLGKPVEAFKRATIRRILEVTGEYPLSNYFRYVDLPAALAWKHNVEPDWFRGQFPCMIRDDDMDYPVIGLRVLEKYGTGFSTADMGAAWLELLPYNMVYTAERLAYRNLVDGYQPPATATVKNPYREWIGAQIRADIWGWIAPGRPELAAEYAYRDAALSHAKNGVYGEMLMAAMIAAAFATDDIHEIIRVGLSEIPATCRLAEAVRDVVAWSQELADWERCIDRIEEKYGHYHRVHTINNAAFVVMGLLYSGGQLEAAICRSVMAGEDTDCNGATAGSILGVLLGAQRLPAKWVAPLNDRLLSIVVGDADNPISSLARRTLRFVPED
jgi:ADP-ribosylglycohydrolase